MNNERVVNFLDLSFQVLDDLCLGVERDRVTSNILSSLCITNISPAIEALHLANLFESKGLEMRWLRTDFTRALFEDFASGRSRSQLNGDPTGWIIGRELIDLNNNWTGFLMRAKKAAVNAGFDRITANGITGALEEFRSNVLEHSQNGESGYAIFHSSQGNFEFIVADYGEGVLNSLKRNVYYANLADHGEALRLAVTEGVSRHSSPDRGNGFRPLLVGLANIAGYIRFRSGDHSYEFKRVSPSTISSKSTQRVFLPGFSCAVMFRL